MMGGALGLAVLASLAAARSGDMLATQNALAALNSGYHVAFAFGAVFAAAAGVIGGVMLRAGRPGGAEAAAHLDADDGHGASAAERPRPAGNTAATEKG
jgi:hypothetical protein